MPHLVFILSPPRSYSTVISNMLGQHPQMYCFPELHLFVGDTLADVLAYHQRMPNLYTDGLFRAVAELEFGGQTVSNIDQAERWLVERGDWPSHQVLDELVGKVAANVAVEKSPITAFKTAFLQRLGEAYPKAKFIHLVRHPLSSVHSMVRVYRDHDFFGRPMPVSIERAAMLWYQSHANIVAFTKALAQDQWLRLRGEDVLDQPRLQLARISAWLGLDSDEAAVEAMLHPERSPYARFGPDNARLGNDATFFHEPRLRQRDPQEVQLLSPQLLEKIAAHAPNLFALAKTFGYV